MLYHMRALGVRTEHHTQTQSFNSCPLVRNKLFGNSDALQKERYSVWKRNENRYIHCMETKTYEAEFHFAYKLKEFPTTYKKFCGKYL